jgi:hypothetical protein
MGIEGHIWSCWRQNELFHVNAILGLDAQAQTDSNPPPAQEEHHAPLIIVDIGQPVPTLTPGANL